VEIDRNKQGIKMLTSSKGIVALKEGRG
jgi:hypothetical protein